MSDSLQTRCAACGGPVVNGQCATCGLPEADGGAATAKRLRVPSGTLDMPDNRTMPRVPALANDQTVPRNPALKPTDLPNAEPAITQTGETKALIEKSIKGTQWIMVAILIGVPLGFLTRVVLGRVSPATLGVYTLMTLLVTTVQTFFLFGGANVIVNFIPRASAREKSKLLVSYTGLALAFSVIFFIAMLIFPQPLHFLLRSQLQNQRFDNTSIYLFLLMFVPVIICQTLTIAVLQGEMELGASARTQYGVQVTSFLLALIAAYVVLPHHLLPDLVAVPLVVLGAYLLSFGSGFMTLWKVMRQRWQPAFGWYLPPRFWTFTLTFHVNTIVAFFFNSIDQFYIYFAFSTNDLGLYSAALATATLALWAPNLFTGAMYPFFTNLVARNDMATLKAAFQRYSAISCVVVAFVSLAFGLFAPEILGLFGKQYGLQSLPLMIVFALMYVVFASAAYVPSTALITAHEDIWLNLILNITALAIRASLYGPLTSQYHLLGVAFANAISLGVLYTSTLIAIGLRYRVSVPLRQHLVSLTGGVLLIGPYLIERFQPANHLLQFTERGLALVIFVVVVSQLRLVSRADFEKIATRFGNNKLIRRFLPKVA